MCQQDGKSWVALLKSENRVIRPKKIIDPP